MAKERECLSSGNVFVWEEGDDEGGLLRKILLFHILQVCFSQTMIHSGWTDGRQWYKFHPYPACNGSTTNLSGHRAGYVGTIYFMRKRLKSLLKRRRRRRVGGNHILYSLFFPLLILMFQHLSSLRSYGSNSPSSEAKGPPLKAQWPDKTNVLSTGTSSWNK